MNHSMMALALVCLISSRAVADELPWIRVGEDKKSFVAGPGGERFTPWGFNYDHDDRGRLLEDYWDSEWAAVEEDFREMRQLGANVVRIHLQLGRFMDAADKANTKSLERLEKLLALAERERLYLDLTGLGCYHKQDVPPWYDALPEQGRWDVQARFWESVAARCANSPAVFCYDLMNEPVVPGGRRNDGDWLGPAFGGKHFVQVISLDQRGRPRPAVARQWVKHLTAAVRKHDQRHLITVGLVDWSLDRKGLTSGFVPSEIVGDLDFVSVHLYPEAGKVDEALETLAGFAAVGKPVLIEETFPLKCSIEEFGRFVEGSKKHAAGWVGFYWGKPPEELRRSTTIGGVLMLRWLEFFEQRADPGGEPSGGRSDGRNDEEVSGPVVALRGEADLEAAPHGEGNVYAPDVLVEGKAYRMWYGGQGRDGHDRILYAESADGLRWVGKGVAVEDPSANHVNDPSVVKVGGTYYMYFTLAKRDVLDVVALATSEDGLRWQRRGTVLPPGAAGEWDSLSVGRPSVLHEGGVFKMWYDGRKDLPPGAPAEGVPTSPASTRSVGFATSMDGLTWKKHSDNPVFGRGAGGVDVKRVGEKYVLLYESHDGTNAATSNDGIGWRDHETWLAKSGGEDDAHGHVTPFLLVPPDGRGAAVLYYGAASAATWDHNAVAVWPVPQERWDVLAGRRERP